VQHFNFSDAEWTTYLKSLRIPHLEDWMLDQAARGQAYYRNRLRRIRFSGEKVLDAGCGVGNWSVALACLFEKVYAVENDEERLRVLEGMISHFEGRIIPLLASVEQLPFRDLCFDAVFCNGVIFVCNYRKALAEFARVLKPNAPLYVSYDGKAWWRHLIHERAKADPVCVIYGANGLISLLFRLLDEIVLEDRAERTLRDHLTKELIDTFGFGFSDASRQQIAEAHARFLAAPRGDTMRRRLETAALAAGRDALENIRTDPLLTRKSADSLLVLGELTSEPVPVSYRERVAADLLARLVLGRSCHEIEIHTYSYEPEEMTKELMRHGFHTILSGSEGCLCLDSDAPSVKPIHELRLGVFESRALAPDAAMRGPFVASVSTAATTRGHLE